MKTSLGRLMQKLDELESRIVVRIPLPSVDDIRQRCKMSFLGSVDLPARVPPPSHSPRQRWTVTRHLSPHERQCILWPWHPMGTLSEPLRGRSTRDLMCPVIGIEEAIYCVTRPYSYVSITEHVFSHSLQGLANRKNKTGDEKWGLGSGQLYARSRNVSALVALGY